MASMKGWENAKRKENADSSSQERETIQGRRGRENGKTEIVAESLGDIFSVDLAEKPSKA